MHHGGAGPGNAVLVIGHSPQVDWLLHQLVTPRDRWPWLRRYQHTFGGSEIVCVDLGENTVARDPIGRGHVIWSLGPGDKTTEDLLREKIKGKMESAKLLGGIVGAGLAFVLAGFHDLALGWSSTMDDAARELLSRVPKLDGERLIFFGGSLGALLLATGLYISAYLSYDRLLMPARFWAATEPPENRWRGIVWRPPSSSLLVMHQNMQRIWLRAFIPAVFIAGVALVLFAYAAIIQQLADAIGDLCDEKSSVIPRFSDLVGYLHGAAAPKQVAASCRGAGIARITFGGVVVVVCAILGVLHWWARPLLGAQD